MIIFRSVERGGEQTTCYVVDEYGPIRVIEPDGSASECFSLPTDAYELLTRSEVYDEIFEALNDIQLSKTARNAVESLIDGLPS